MLPEDLSFFDRLEEWLEAQVPRGINEFPHRVFETMERMSNEILDTLNIQGVPSISIPFPPFSEKEIPPPPPPVIPSLYDKAEKLVKAHPYVIGTGAAVALTCGLTYGGALLGYGGVWGEKLRNKRKFGTRGVVEDGMMKEAIVILSPSPMPPMLWALTITLLKAGYIVLVAVPRVEDAEMLEKRLNPLEEKGGLRVLIYDPDDINTFPPFQRSLSATMTLRFPAANAPSSAYDKPVIPHIHAYISLYPLHPDPPNQPSALPALPTLLSPQNNRGKTPMLLNIYPSGSVIVNPDSFSSQVLTANHRLLGQNLAVSHDNRVVSLYVGHLSLPPLHQMLNNVRLMIYRFTLKEKWVHATTLGKLSVIKEAITSFVTSSWWSLTGRLGIGSAAKDYAHFENRFLRILKSSRGTRYHAGQYSYLPFIIQKFPLFAPILPTLPGPTGPLYASIPNLSRSPAPSRTAPSATSATSSDHESGEDMTSSMHSLNSATSSREAESSSVGSGTGMEDSWAHLDAPSR